MNRGGSCRGVQKHAEGTEQTVQGTGAQCRVQSVSLQMVARRQGPRLVCHRSAPKFQVAMDSVCSLPENSETLTKGHDIRSEYVTVSK